MARKKNWITWQHIHIEGNILSADILEQISEDKALAQSHDDYQLPRGLSLMDEIGYSYKNAQGLWSEYSDRINNPKNDPAEVTRDFITKFFDRCLGWDIELIRKLDADGRSYPIRRIAFDEFPILTAVAGNNSLDKADTRYSVTNGQKKITPFQMLQQYLSAAGPSKWGIVSNGEMIRLLRSSTALSKPQYLEFNLKSILEDDFYNEYAVLWKVLHYSRIWNKVTGEKLTIWEEWQRTTVSDGQRVRDRLRVGVTRSLRILGTELLKNNENAELRDRIDSGHLSVQDFYHQLLRCVYRLLFLFVTEERYSEKGIRLIFDPASTPEARYAFDSGYSLSRLRKCLRSNKYFNNFNDLWEAQRVVFRSLEKGELKLGLPSLGGLFSSDVCPDVDTNRLSNKAFLQIIKNLRIYEDTNTAIWIDYKNLGTQELGSVYESLLELAPVIDKASWTFRFIDFDDEETNAGNARKSTGSYYTPDFLVSQLIKTALVPTVEKKIAENPGNEEAAILSMKVVDPACGSGHFLIAAASSMAVYLCKYRENGDTITGYQEAYRDVISNCIYGVDLNPMAVELTRMALWLEGYEPGKPLSFLDSHIKCGNSLLTVFDMDNMLHGIPMDAFPNKVLYGEDKNEVTRLMKKNREELKNLKASLEEGSSYIQKSLIPHIGELNSIEDLPENSLSDIENKKKAYIAFEQKIESSTVYKAFLVYIGTYFVHKHTGVLCPTSALLYRVLTDASLPEDEPYILNAIDAAKSQMAFNWNLEFFSVMANGGFDVVLGNPPWDKNKLKDEEFFASRVAEITNAQNASKRKKLIEKLKTGNDLERTYYDDYQNTMNMYSCANRFYVSANHDGQFPLAGRGDVNLYSLFAELMLKLKNDNGAAGFVCPTGICTDDTTKFLFREFVGRNELASIYDFENHGIFPAVHNSYKFSLLTLRKLQSSDTPDYAFFLHNIKELEDERRHFPLTAEDIKMFNPNTWTMPVIRSNMDYQILKKIYQNSTVIWDENKEDGNTYGLSFMSMFHMSNDSHLFLDEPTDTSLPLYEGKFISHYDYRFNSYEGDKDSKGKPISRNLTLEEKQDINKEVTPQYWVEAKEVYYRYSTLDKKQLDAWYNDATVDMDDSLFASVGETVDGIKIPTNEEVINSTPKWCFGIRSISNTTNIRTIISCIFPLSGAGHSMNLIKGISLNTAILLNANMSSFVFDYAARRKIGGTNISLFYIKQLPIISINMYSDQYAKLIIRYSKILLGITKKMAKILGVNVEIWNIEIREKLQARINAMYFTLYGLSRNDIIFIMSPQSLMGHDYPSDTFPAVECQDITEYGDYRTKRLILEAYDELMENGLWTDI